FAPGAPADAPLDSLDCPGTAGGVLAVRLAAGIAVLRPVAAPDRRFRGPAPDRHDGGDAAAADVSERRVGPVAVAAASQSRRRRLRLLAVAYLYLCATPARTRIHPRRCARVRDVDRMAGIPAHAGAGADQQRRRRAFPGARLEAIAPHRVPR